MSWTRTQHRMNVNASRVSLVVWIQKVRIARISRLSSPSTSIAEGSAPKGRDPPKGGKAPVTGADREAI
jgi:hypothetical protein